MLKSILYSYVIIKGIRKRGQRETVRRQRHVTK